MAILSTFTYDFWEATDSMSQLVCESVAERDNADFDDMEQNVTAIISFEGNVYEDFSLESQRAVNELLDLWCAELDMEEIDGNLDDFFCEMQHVIVHEEIFSNARAELN